MASRPCNISYGEAVNSPNSPNIVVNSPSTPRSYSVSPYNPGTPIEKSQIEKSQTYVTRTSAVYIPRWAASYVFGGRDIKHFSNLCKNHGDYVTNVPCSDGKNWTTFKQPNGQIYAIMTLIGYGSAKKVEDAIKAVTDGLVEALRKAKQMKTDGKWREHSDHRSNNRHRDDRHRHRSNSHHNSHHRDDRHRSNSRHRNDRHRRNIMEARFGPNPNRDYSRMEYHRRNQNERHV